MQARTHPWDPRVCRLAAVPTLPGGLIVSDADRVLSAQPAAAHRTARPQRCAALSFFLSPSMLQCQPVRYPGRPCRRGRTKAAAACWRNRCTRHCYRCVQHLYVLPPIHHRSRFWHQCQAHACGMHDSLRLYANTVDASVLNSCTACKTSARVCIVGLSAAERPTIGNDCGAIRQGHHKDMKDAGSTVHVLGWKHSRTSTGTLEALLAAVGTGRITAHWPSLHQLRGHPTRSTQAATGLRHRVVICMYVMHATYVSLVLLPGYGPVMYCGQHI